MTKNLAKYIYKKMLNEPRNYQWRVVIDEGKGAVEIYFVLTLELKAHENVQDINAQVNKEDTLYFEDVVCFYDKENTKIVPENYLYAVPLDAEVGIERGYVDAFLKQLNIVASNGRSQLRKFFAEESQQEFSLNWNEENMKNTVRTMRKTKKYSKEILDFSTNEEQSLVDQFKEEQYDGMERV